MATVNGFTKEKQQAIMNATIISGAISGDNLILTRQGGGTVNAGNVRGPTGSPGATVSELNNAIPIGLIADYIEATPPTNWLAIIGQTIVGGATTYAALWAKLPASMKSGSDIVFPNTKQRVSVGYDASDSNYNAIGKLGGAASVTLAEANLAVHYHAQTSHTHVVDPPNTAVAMNESPHNHSQNAHGHVDYGHNHGQNPHNHFISSAGTGFNFIIQGGSGSSGVQATAGPYILSANNSTDAATAVNQAAAANISYSTASNNAAYTYISGTVDIAAFTSAGASAANTATAGSATPFSVVQPYFVTLKIIRAL